MNDIKYPNVVNIETINMCNARCITCPVKFMKRKKEIMSLSLFKKIIDNLAEDDYSGFVSPFQNGEPFLTPNFLEYLRYMKTKLPKASVRLFSNASLLTDELSQTILNEDLLDILVISFDGGTKEAYEKVRIGLDFDKVRTNAHRFIAIRNSLKKSKPIVNISMTYKDENKDTVNKLKNEFKDANAVELHKFLNWGGQLNDVKYEKHSKLWNILHKQNFCSLINNMMVILSNGNVVPCCFDYEGILIVGNIKKSSIKEIYNGEKMNKIRYDLKHRNFNNLPMCSRCDALDFNIIERQFVRFDSIITSARFQKLQWLRRILKNTYLSIKKS